MWSSMFGFIFEEQHLYTPLICLANWPIVVHIVVFSFLCHIWTYYYRSFPLGTVGCLSVLSFCSLILSLHLCILMPALLFSFSFWIALIFLFISLIGCVVFFVCLFYSFFFCSVSSLLFSILSLHLLRHCYVILFLSLIFTLFLFPFFFICSYLSVSGFNLSLYILILATIFVLFCVFFFCFYFTQLIVMENVNGSLSYTMWFVSWRGFV